MKRVLIVSCVFSPEPVVSAQISKDIAISLSDQGCDVTVLAPMPSRPAGFDFSEFYEDLGENLFKLVLPDVRVLNLSSRISPNPSILGRFHESWSFGKSVASYLKNVDHNFDIVYINSWPIFSQYIIAKACLELAIPYVVHIQDIYPESLSNKLPKFFGRVINMFLLPFDKYQMKNAKKIIVISAYMRDEISNTRNIFKGRFEIVHNWQDEKSFEILISEKADRRFTFMYLGNIGPVAGVETLIKGFVLSNLLDCELIIAGSGANKKSCIDLTQQLNATNIKFVDVPNGEVASTQSLADVFLLPVIKGGANSSIPSKLPAYMFSAKPIIGTLDTNTATADAIKKAGCGWLGEAEDEEWLSNQMRAVSKMSKIELDLIGKSGYEYGLANFSKKINLNKILKQLIND